jgi:hypothetical protein
MYQNIIYISILLIILFFYSSQNLNTNNNKNIQKLLRQSARWAVAAEQDTNPLIAVLHANYGAGYLWALKDIANNEDIKNATGIDMKTFENKIINIQDTTTKRMAKLCPEYAGDSDKFLSAVSGEG